MRLALVMAGFGVGGAEKVVNLLAHHRRQYGDEVQVLAVNATDSRSHFVYAPEIDLVALSEGCGNRPGISAAAGRARRLRWSLRNFAPDLVISFLTKVNVMTSVASMGEAWPLVVSERNNFALQHASLLWRLAMPVTCRRAGRMVMQTEAALRELPAGLRKRAIVIPNPVTTAQPPQRQADDGPVRLIAVGRLDHQKGFDLLLQAFALIAGDLDPEVRLTIFGEGPERHALEQQARDLGIDSRVTMPGVTASAVDWVRAGDVLVLSSRFEGFPNVLLEGLAGGLACIAFDCPWGPREIIDCPDAGLLVPAGDVAALAADMLRLVTDRPLRTRLQENGPRVAQLYSLPVVMERWDAVIADSVAGRLRVSRSAAADMR